MEVQTPEWKDRIAHWIRTLTMDFYHPLGEIFWEAFFTEEQLSLEEAKQKAFVPVSPGMEWGHTWEYGWFHGKVILPDQAAGQRIVLDLKADGEAVLFVNDQAFGTYRADWIQFPHHYLVDNYITDCGEEGQVYEIYMEVYGGHDYPTCERENAYRATGPVLEEKLEPTRPEGKRRTVGRSTFGIWNEEAYQLYMDVMTLDQLLETLDPSGLRAVKVEEALEEFTLQVDFEQSPEERQKDYRKAREILKPALQAKNGSTAPVFYSMGNAHIDLAWLWPFAETYRKSARTFAAQLRLLEEYPEYRFIQSQPALYEMCRKYYPELFLRIKEAVKEGRWIADGAMWVEPDTNMASGEALIRQLLYGKRYYKEMFDVDSQVLWLPDSFGYTAALPQILQGCGVKYLVTQKIFWSYNGGEQFPYHYFYWEGMDGTRVTNFLPTSYTYKTNPAEANEVWKNRSQKRDLEVFLFPFGYGDGGGGPCRDHIEYIRRTTDLEGSVQMKMCSPQEFFTEMDKQGGPKHTYVGEMYFSAHRGTYTTQALMKKNNRKGEFMMHDLELWSSLAALNGLVYPAKKLEEMWKVVLLHQFHDILPGSSIGRVYEEAKEAFEELYQEGVTVKRDIMAEMAKEPGISVWNSLGFQRSAVISLPEEYRQGVLVNGKPVAAAWGLDGPEALIQLPSCGAVSLQPAVVEPCSSLVRLREEEGIYVFENSCLQVCIDGQGQVISYVLRGEDWSQEFAAGPMNQFLLYKDIPRKYDAWDIDANYIDQQVEDAVLADSCEILQSEGMKAVLKVSGKIGKSPYTQLISLEADSARLEFSTSIDWKERHRLLKVGFPVRVYGEMGIHEMQFGYVERPTHRSRLYDQDRFEVCNHHYSALCDQSHGMAVLNDCKYRISMNENRLELTLLRGASSPDFYADRGTHTFTYGIYGWKGSFFDSQIVQQGYEINCKPEVVPMGCQPFSAFQVNSPNVILESVKMAEDGSGDMILRLYESKKAETQAEVVVDLSAFHAVTKEVWECNLLEEEKTKLFLKNGRIQLQFRAFEIKTLRVKI